MRFLIFISYRWILLIGNVFDEEKFKNFEKVKWFVDFICEIINYIYIFDGSINKNSRFFFVVSDDCIIIF